MIDLRAALGDYLRIRRQLGFELKSSGRMLTGFVGFLERAGAEHVTAELALAWAKLPQDAHPHWWRQRLGMVRGFARYLVTIDPDSEVPSDDLLPAARQRVAPYIYSEAEIERLMAAARALTPRLRAATFETLIGLMATTGLRLGEALGLDRQDVDLDDGALHVRAAKQSKQREVPLHVTTTRALRDYARLRDRSWPDPETPAFFVYKHGRRLTRDTVYHTFPNLIRQAGLEGAGKRTRPRPHDLRHAFAVRTLLGWYRSGCEVEREMPLLSTYLGHYAGDLVKGDTLRWRVRVSAPREKGGRGSPSSEPVGCRMWARRVARHVARGGSSVETELEVCRGWRVRRPRAVDVLARASRARRLAGSVLSSSALRASVRWASGHRTRRSARAA